MRNIKHIIIHCSATPPDMDVKAKDIDEWHKKRGFDGIGYHYVIRRNGKIEKGRDIDQAGAHAKGFNFCSIGVCLIGGIDENGKSQDNYSRIQKEKLIMLVDFLVVTFPDADIIGHRDLPGVNKDCPSFNIKEFFGGSN